MTIKTIKELETLIKLCKKQGVSNFSIGEISFSLSYSPDKRIQQSISKLDPDAFPEAQVIVPKFNGEFNDAPDVIKTEELTEEQLRDWSVKSDEVGQ